MSTVRNESQNINRDSQKSRSSVKSHKVEYSGDSLGFSTLVVMFAIVALEMCRSPGSSVGVLVQSAAVQSGHLLSSVSQSGPCIHRLLSLTLS